MKIKKKIVYLLLTVMLIMNSFVVHANSNEPTGVTGFGDVPTTYWAHDAIMLMANHQIISGYKDGTFRPDASVSRAEFAKMMVLTMQLSLVNPPTPTFLDVPRNGWDYKYIETAKSYLTGYRFGTGLSYRPTQGAQREDMAVAIVKGLNIQPSEGAALDVLNTLTDSSTISTNLKGYVAAAISNGIMIGDDLKKFNPQATITRAQTATLLARLIDGEKIVFDEEKIVLDDSQIATTIQKPFLDGYIKEDKLILDWTEVDSADFTYYKIVLSKKDATPSYPDNGYATYISKVSLTAYEIKAGDGYNGGDFSGKIAPGTYYAAITAIYGDTKVTSNVIQVTVPERDYGSISELTPVLTSAINYNGGIKLTWSKTDDDDVFNYYKVVVSKSNSNPSYPDDGYATYISNRSETSYVLRAGDAYNGGDIGGELVAGKNYYVTITAVYSNGKYTSNTKTIKLP